MDATKDAVEVSVIVPARDEEANLAKCLASLVEQPGVSYELIVVDDHSVDRTREIARSFAVQVMEADPLAAGWSGKCNACWSGAKVAAGKWLLFTDADTRHSAESIASGLREAEAQGAALLSYSPKQEVHSLAEHALMPVIFAELAVSFRPREVSDPASPAAAANGQYLLIRRDAYDAVGGHAAVASAILEDVELARRVKSAGYRLQFRQSDVVSSRMYRSWPQMWEGWTKNLVLLFPNARGLALRRGIEFGLIAWSVIAAVIALLDRDRDGLLLNGVLAFGLLVFFYQRIRRAHFDWLSNVCAVFGLPLFMILLLRSYICHKRGSVEWKGRRYTVDAASVEPANYTSLSSSPACGGLVARDDTREGTALRRS
jgi:cellulose synthase/poly-beta-1,6-N-acetylglucosamine synthase-like glycosyltransferase